MKSETMDQVSPKRKNPVNKRARDDYTEEDEYEIVPVDELLHNPKKSKQKQAYTYDDEYMEHDLGTQKGMIQAVQNPSYCLKMGVGSLTFDGGHLRSYHRKRLWAVFNRIMARNDWVECSGVLSVLLRGSRKDASVSRNRAKYRASLELLHHIRGEKVSIERVNNLFGCWLSKMSSVRGKSLKNRNAVTIEHILLLLQRGDMEKAYQATRSRRVEKGFDSDPISNLVFGLVFYQQWYSGLPEALQLVDIDDDDDMISTQSEGLVDSIHRSSAYTNDKNDNNERRAGSPLKSYSDTSIAMGKVFEDDGCKQAEHTESGEQSTGEASSSPISESSVPDTYSGEASGRSNDRGHNVSIYDSRSLPKWLVPLQLPESHEDLEDTIYNHKKLQNDDYFCALEHLRAALYSTPPVTEAFHPLIQMLLLGDEVNEALEEVNKFSRSSDSILHLRLEASMLEHFDKGNYVKLVTCLEKIMKKDPTCGDSLSKLTLMHQRGEYETQSMVEMIALHLEASDGICDMWKELASGLLKLSQCEEDRISTCYDGNGQSTLESLDTRNKIPELLTKGESGKAWRFRCRWWLNRHFNCKKLASDIASGYLELLTYKASVAAYLYGRHFSYVMKANECLDKENNMELFSVLQMHILNSVGLYSVENEGY